MPETATRTQLSEITSMVTSNSAVSSMKEHVMCIFSFNSMTSIPKIRKMALKLYVFLLKHLNNHLHNLKNVMSHSTTDTDNENPGVSLAHAIEESMSL